MSSRFLVMLLLLVAIGMSACSSPPATTPGAVLVLRADQLPAAPDDAAWQKAPIHPAQLMLQDLVEPRLLDNSTPEVRVRAIANATDIAILLEWDDTSADALPGVARFSDACAVQFPEHAAIDVPAPQMGETGRVVQISYWRAFWQSTVDGLGDTIGALYPNAVASAYPFTAASIPPGSDTAAQFAARYAPARALHNPMAGPRAKPVQDLLATGPGTIGPDPVARASGRGMRTRVGWAVLLARPLPDGLTPPAGTAPGGRTQVAFAVWEGTHSEAGARKMRTGWIPISFGQTP